MDTIGNAIPEECVLWRTEELSLKGMLAPLALVRTYEDSSHLSRHLLRCTECGHLYFKEFYEVVDWGGGNDGQYVSLIPVDDEASADAMSEMDPMLLNQFRAIHMDHPLGSEDPTPPPYWNCRPKPTP